jgi:hypothetical protein
MKSRENFLSPMLTTYIPVEMESVLETPLHILRLRNTGFG